MPLGPTSTQLAARNAAVGAPATSSGAYVTGDAATGNANGQHAVLPMLPPTTTAQFGSLPQGSQKAPAVVTSSAAEDHVNGMSSAATQATLDAQSLAAHNAATAAAASMPADTSETDKPSDTSSASSSMDDLMKSLGLDTADLTDQQKQVVAEDTAQIAQDHQTQQQVGAQIDAMSAGTFPLTPAEQNQINATRAAFNDSMRAAMDYTNNVKNGATTVMARNGMQMYSPNIALGKIQEAVTAASAKISAVNQRINSAVSKLTTALQNADYKTATGLYKQIGTDITTRQKEIDSINKTVSDANQALLKSNLDATKTFNTSLTKILESAGNAGAPAEVIDAISSSPDIASAIKAAGTYLQPTSNSGLIGEYATYAQQARALGQNPIEFMDFAKRMANLKTAAPKSGGTPALNVVGAQGTKADGTPVTQADTTSWLSDFYGSGGNVSLPSLGIGNLAAGVKVGILNGIASHAMTLGISGSKFASILASKQGAKQAINTISRNQGMMTVAESTANKNFDQILTQMNTLPPKTINPLLNQFVQSGSIQVGDPNIKPFAALLMTALNEYAKVITGQTSGAAVSDAARREAQSMIASGDTTDSIRNFVTTAKLEMDNRVTGYGDAKNQFYDLIGSVYGDAVPPPDASADAGDPANILGEEKIAQDKVDQATGGRPDLMKTVYTMLSQPDATLGRPLTYSEILQVLQATGQIK